MGQPFIGKTYLSIGSGSSPETFARYCEIDSISGIGTKNALVDVTTFCSDGFMEYIAGLSDGAEITFNANYVLDMPDRALQEGLIDDVEDKNNRRFQVQIGDGSPSEEVMEFTLAMLSWEFDPDVKKQNAIKFTGKITGRILRTF